MTAGSKIFRFGTCDTCCGDDVTCPCEHCEGGDGQRCCLTVTLSGVTDGSCISCDALINRTYNMTYVSQPSPSCRWTCFLGRQSNLSFGCAYVNAGLELLNVGGDYIIRFVLDHHLFPEENNLIWERNAGTIKPLCTELTGTDDNPLPLLPVSGGPKCSIADSTALIGNKDDSEECECTPGSVPCFNCPGDANAPAQMEVVIAGIIDYVPKGFRCNDAGSDCNDLNDVFVLDFVSSTQAGCHYCLPDLGMCDDTAQPGDDWIGNLTLLISDVGIGSTKITVSFNNDAFGIPSQVGKCPPASHGIGHHGWSKTFTVDELTDCLAIDGEALDYVRGDDGFLNKTCDSSASTCVITSAGAL